MTSFHVFKRNCQIWPGKAWKDSNPYTIFQAFESAGIRSSGEYNTARKRVDIMPVYKVAKKEPSRGRIRGQRGRWTSEFLRNTWRCQVGCSQNSLQTTTGRLLCWSPTGLRPALGSGCWVLLSCHFANGSLYCSDLALTPLGVREGDGRWTTHLLVYGSSDHKERHLELFK